MAGAMLMTIIYTEGMHSLFVFYFVQTYNMYCKPNSFSFLFLSFLLLYIFNYSIHIYMMYVYKYIFFPFCLLLFPFFSLLFKPPSNTFSQQIFLKIQHI